MVVCEFGPHAALWLEGLMGSIPMGIYTCITLYHVCSSPQAPSQPALRTMPGDELQECEFLNLHKRSIHCSISIFNDHDVCVRAKVVVCVCPCVCIKNLPAFKLQFQKYAFVHRGLSSRTKELRHLSRAR